MPDNATVGSVGWFANEERLLGLLVVSDAKAQALSEEAGEAFFRAFIVVNRATGEVSMKFRFRYRDGKDSWFSVKPNLQGSQQDSFRELREGISSVLMEGATLMGAPLSPLDIECFEPPDDDGHWERTIEWLKDKDLIKPPTFVPAQGKDAD